jgi:ABC-type phosphate transport system substrate-binding protein
MKIMIKITAFAVLATVAGCGGFGRGTPNGDSVTSTVPGTRAEALEIARTQLVHHGFTVTGAGSDVLVTTPKLVPDYLREVSTAKPNPQRWFVVVQGTDVHFFRGTHVRVSGYLLPPGAGTVAAVKNGTRLEQSAIPITQQNPRLFREVQAVSSWITSEAKRKK